MRNGWVHLKPQLKRILVRSVGEARASHASAKVCLGTPQRKAHAFYRTGSSHTLFHNPTRPIFTYLKSRNPLFIPNSHSNSNFQTLTSISTPLSHSHLPPSQQLRQRQRRSSTLTQLNGDTARRRRRQRQVGRYYCAPSGKKLRSMVEIQKYLLEHPQYSEQGVRLSQFSFQIPKPLQENYVRKRPPVPRVSNPLDGERLLEPDEVNPLSWVQPTEEEHPIPHYYSHYHEGTAFCHPPPESSPPPSSVSPSPPLKKKSSKPRIYIKNCSNSGPIVQPATDEL